MVLLLVFFKTTVTCFLHIWNPNGRIMTRSQSLEYVFALRSISTRDHTADSFLLIRHLFSIRFRCLLKYGSWSIGNIYLSFLLKNYTMNYKYSIILICNNTFNHCVSRCFDPWKGMALSRPLSTLLVWNMINIVHDNLVIKNTLSFCDNE